MRSDNPFSKKEISPSIIYNTDYRPKSKKVSGDGKEYSINQYSIDSSNVLTAIISDRIYFIKDTIDEINAQIQERNALKQTLTIDIEEKLRKVKNIIYELELDMCNRIDKSRRRTSLEKQISELYKEKRQQELLHWQDTVMLKKELRNAEKELLDAMADVLVSRFLS